MSVPGIIACLFAILGVWLTIKQSVYCWPVAMTGICFMIADLYNARLYGDMSLQVFYFFTALYGWIYWEKNSNRKFEVKKMPAHYIPILLLATGLQFFLYYYLLVHFKGKQPELDAALTAASITTTYMMTKKWVENWFVWVIVDTIYLFLFAATEMWLYVGLYLFFAVMAYYGWVKWKKLVLLK